MTANHQKIDIWKAIAGQRFVLCSLLAIAMISPFTQVAAAQASTWQLDPDHTLVRFAVRHMVIENVRGGFSKVSGTVQYDPKDISKTVIQVTIDTASEDSLSDARDKDVKSPMLLDVEKYPTITFQSKRVEQAGQGHAKVTGDLTIHGVTKEVVLDVEGPTAVVRTGKKLHMGASTSLTLNRKDYGINYNRILDNGGAIVGDDVAITLDIDMTHPAPEAPPAE